MGGELGRANSASRARAYVGAGIALWSALTLLTVVIWQLAAGVAATEDDAAIVEIACYAALAGSNHLALGWQTRPVLIGYGAGLFFAGTALENLVGAWGSVAHIAGVMLLLGVYAQWHLANRPPLTEEQKEARQQRINRFLNRLLAGSLISQVVALALFFVLLVWLDAEDAGLVGFILACLGWVIFFVLTATQDLMKEDTRDFIALNLMAMSVTIGLGLVTWTHWGIGLIAGIVSFFTGAFLMSREPLV